MALREEKKSKRRQKNTAIMRTGGGIIGLMAVMLALVLGSGIYVHAAEEVQVSDVSDMVYQAGGWGTPVEEAGSSASFYAMTPRDRLKADIFTALSNGASQLDVSDYGYTNINDINVPFAEVLNEHPELFYVSSSMSWSTRNSVINNCYFFYLDFTDAEKNAYGRKIQEAISLIDDGMSDEEKALVLHDYLAQHCAYAYQEYLSGQLDSASNVFSAYGALVEGRAVCQGYSEAYRALLRAVGIDSSISTSKEMSHAWNVVWIDGEWYHVDVTWDDPVWNTEGYARHSYFLLSDAEMGNRDHYGWSDSVDCSSVKYDADDYWWQMVESQIVMGDKQYYITDSSDSKGFQLVERNGGNSTVKYSNASYWDVWGGSGRWGGSYSYLSRQGDYLYFNDKLNLYALKMTESEPKIIYTYDGGDGYIYGAMVYEDGKARLNISKTPNKETDAYIIVDLSEQIELPAPQPAPEKYTGLVQVSSGAWLCMSEGKVQSDYTGLWYDAKVGWWYVENGAINFDYYGLVPYGDAWWCVAGGRLAFEYTGLWYDAKVGWWYVENGAINFDYSGLVQYGDVWWCIAGGRVAFEYTGLWYDPNVGWWYVENGAINFGYYGLAPYDDAWWCIAGGRLAFEYTGLWYDANVGWWYVENGAINFDHSGLVQYGDTWWCIAGGRVAFEYTGLWYDANVGWWYVENGAINFGYNGLVQYGDVWWCIAGGRAAFEYTGLWYDANVGWWYVENGAINFDYSGMVEYSGNIYTVNGGAVVL